MKQVLILLGPTFTIYLGNCLVWRKLNIQNICTEVRHSQLSLYKYNISKENTAMKIEPRGQIT